MADWLNDTLGSNSSQWGDPGLLPSPSPFTTPLNFSNSTVPLLPGVEVGGWNLRPVEWVYLASGIASGIAGLWSFHTMDKHIRYNKHGVMRAYVVRILFMVPIYAMAAFLGLIQESFSIWWNVVREVYEAFTIYSFINFLVAYVGTKHDVTQLVLKRYTKGRRLIFHLWPCNKCCRGPASPQHFMLNVNIGVMQYVVVQIVMALLSMYLTAVGRYKEGEWSHTNAYPYFVVVKNCSQTWALYDLVWFYHSLQAELAGCNPLPKALCIKGVVFFTYWQSVLFAILANFGALDWLHALDLQDPMSFLQNFIICFEMLVAAILHAVYFPFDEFNTLPPRDTDMSLDIEHQAPPSPLTALPFEAVQGDLLTRCSPVLCDADVAPECSRPASRSSTPPACASPTAAPPDAKDDVEVDEAEEAKQALADTLH